MVVLQCQQCGAKVESDSAETKQCCGKDMVLATEPAKAEVQTETPVEQETKTETQTEKPAEQTSTEQQTGQ